MIFLPMIVCSSAGRTEIYTTSDGNNIETVDLVGKIMVKVNNPFVFYAVESISTGLVNLLYNGKMLTKMNGQLAADTTSLREVLIVMPLGGTESGLFRQPRVGDRVLVAQEGGFNYLMGYMPSLDKEYGNNFSADNAAANMAQVFRYNNNGVNFSDSAYSEIAFRSNYSKVEGASIPIDSITIKSTGNILNSAGNNYSLQADGLNIGVGGADKNNAVITADAAGNVTIEAANAITLKVGRTTLSISNTSFSVESQIADSPISNTWNASLSLSPRSGFSASGMNCLLNAVKKAVMSDGMGGMFSTAMGVGSIKGREIKLANYNAKEYSALNITADIAFVENMLSLINGMEYQDKQRDLEKNAADQEKMEAEAAQKAAEAKEAERTANDTLIQAQRARSALNAAEVSADPGLRAALTAAIYKAQEAEEKRHKAVREAKEKRDAVNARQDAIDAVGTWGNITNFVLEWTVFLKTLMEKIYSLYGDWKNLSATRERAHEMERKARLASKGLKDLTQQELEDKAKAKEIADYKKKNSSATDEEAEEHWKELSKEKKDEKIAVERQASRDEMDKVYEDKVKTEANNKACEDLAKARYDALPADPNQATPTWAGLSSEEKKRLTEEIKNTTDADLIKERTERANGYEKDLGEVWKETPDIYKTGGISAPLPADIPNSPGKNP
jgi:hypothetical protein